MMTGLSIAELEVAMSRALDRSLSDMLPDNDEWEFEDSDCFSGSPEAQFAGYDHGIILNFMSKTKPQDDDDTEFETKRVKIALRIVRW